MVSVAARASRLSDGAGLSCYLLMRVVKLCMLLDAMAATVLDARVQLGRGVGVAGREAMRPVTSSRYRRMQRAFLCVQMWCWV